MITLTTRSNTIAVVAVFISAFAVAADLLKSVENKSFVGGHFRSNASTGLNAAKLAPLGDIRAAPQKRPSDSEEDFMPMMGDAQLLLALCAICSLGTSEAFLQRLCSVGDVDKRVMIVNCVRESFPTPELKERFEERLEEHWGTDEVNRAQQICVALAMNPEYQLPKDDMEGYKEAIEEGTNKCFILAK